MPLLRQSPLTLQIFKLESISCFLHLLQFATAQRRVLDNKIVAICNCPKKGIRYRKCCNLQLPREGYLLDKRNVAIGYKKWQKDRRKKKHIFEGQNQQVIISQQVIFGQNCPPVQLCIRLFSHTSAPSSHVSASSATHPPFQSPCVR